MKKLLCLISLTFLLVLQIQARHLLGGEMQCTYISTSGNESTYELELHIYRDCFQNGQNLSPFDPTVDFAIYQYIGNSWVFISTISSDDVEASMLNARCPACVDQGIYKASLTLPIIDAPYLISHQRCCYGDQVANINNSGDTGYSFTFEVSPLIQMGQNNPPLTDVPENFIFDVGEEVNFDVSAIDMDGDSLAYSFEAPISGGGPLLDNSGNCDTATPNPQFCLPPYAPVTFIEPTYSPEVPITGINIDPITGNISGNIFLSGHFIFGVKIDEYRNGIKIGTYHRSFQLVILNKNPLDNFKLSVSNAIYTSSIENQNITISYGEIVGQYTKSIKITDDENNLLYSESENILDECGSTFSISSSQYINMCENENRPIFIHITLSNSNGDFYDETHKICVYTCGPESNYLSLCGQSSSENLIWPRQVEAFGSTNDFFQREPFDIECLCDDINLPNTLIKNITEDKILRFSPRSIIADSALWIYNRWGKEVYHTTEYQNDWDSNTVKSGVYFYTLQIGEDVFKKTLTILE